MDSINIQDQIMETRRQAVKTLLGTIPGEDNDRDGLLETPDRVARMYNELFAGYGQDPKEILHKRFSDDQHEEMVIVRDIPFYSLCEHHMVPFIGTASVAYISNGELAGLSKFARLVECYARRLQIQERLTSQVADAINSILKPCGVAVVIKAEHMCMAMRGVKKPGTSTVTSAVRGVFIDNNNIARQEFLALLKI